MCVCVCVCVCVLVYEPRLPCTQVMDAGEIRECGEPHTLLQDPNSLLKDMVRSTGPSASRKLYQIARRRKHSIL